MPYINKTYEIIERYLLGELTGNELIAFEKQLKNDQGLQRELKKQKLLLDSLKYYSDKLTIKSKLEKIQSEIDINELKDQLAHPAVFYKRLINNKFYASLGSAAAVALIITFSALFISGFFKFHKHVADYTQLKNDIRKISSKQNSLWKAFSSMEDRKKPLVPTGTCFTISSNGYFITNYHVVEGVDSAFITNKIDSDRKYKVKVVYEDIKNDLAILRVDDNKFKPLGKIPYTFKKKLSDLGEYVYTLGYSKKDVVFNEGSVSSLSGFNEDSTAYQVSVPVNPGNSGGPVINAEGELIGMICGKNYIKDGATYAIKSSYILSIADSIKVDSVKNKPVLPKINYLRGWKRTQQVKAIQPFIFKVEVYQ